MKRLLIGLLAISSLSASASNEDWKDRLYCYGTMFGSSKFVVELASSTDNDGLERQVYFAKNVDAAPILVASRCSRQGNTLFCGSDKISIKVDIGQKYAGGGPWDAARYSYYATEVTKKGLFSARTETIRCR